MRALVFLAALPLAALAQGEDRFGRLPMGVPTAPGIEGQSSDREFAEKAASAGMFEVRSSQLALQKSKDDQVKSIAQHMIEDHQQANDKLKNLAMTDGLALPTQMTAEQQKMYDQLQMKSGKEFDKEYLLQERQAHREAIGLFEKEAESGQDPALKSFAQQTLPTLKGHSQMLNRAKL